MFSRRFSTDFRQNQMSALLEEKKQQGRETIDLTLSNPTRAGFSYPKREILASLADSWTLSYEPHARGLGEARQAVVDYYRARRKSLSREDVLLTTGTSEAYAFLMKLLTDPGDNLLVPRPSYPLFEFLAAGEGVELTPYTLVYEKSWRVLVEEIPDLVNARTRALIVVNPNNPTGSFISKKEWSALRKIAAESSLALICDEVFCDYNLHDGIDGVVDLDGEDVLTFVLSGLSKVLGLPQLKLGWIVTTGPAHYRIQARQRLELIADTFLSVGSPVQHAAPALMRLRPLIQSQILQRLQGNLQSLTEILDDSPVMSLGVGGGWYAVLRMPPHLSDEEWALKLLLEHDVSVHPGYLYDFAEESLLVVSLIPRESIFREGLRRLAGCVR